MKLVDQSDLSDQIDQPGMQLISVYAMGALRDILMRNFAPLSRGWLSALL